MTDTNAHDYYRRTADGSIDGPHRGSTLKRMALAGTLRPDDQISKSEHGPWVPALKVQGLAFGPRPAPPAPPPPARCPVEAAFEQLLQSEGKAIRPKLTPGQTSGIPVLDVIESVSIAVEAMDAGARMLRGLPRRLHEDFFLCTQVEPADAEAAQNEFGEKFPAGARVLAVLRAARSQTAYVTNGHLLLQTTSDDGSMASTFKGLLKFSPDEIRRESILLKDIRMFRLAHDGGMLSTSSPAVFVNDTNLGYLGLSASGGHVPEKARIFERIVEVAANASRGTQPPE